MPATIVVTGASSGIGRALAVHFSKLDFNVFAVARRSAKLEETKALGKQENIHCITADVATERGRDSIAAALRAQKVSYLVQNAGVIGSISKVQDVSFESWKSAFAVNVDAPYFLTQMLLKQNLFENGARILHVGSGAATQPVVGWSTYNATKAAFFMIYKVLGEELKEKNIYVGSMRPGVVASEMQDMIREAKEENFPLLGYFKGLKEKELQNNKDKAHVPPEDGLDSPENVAHFIEHLLLDMSNEDFGRQEWDIKDSSLQSKWVK